MKLSLIGTKRTVGAFLERVVIEQSMREVELRMLALSCRCQERAAGVSP